MAAPALKPPPGFVLDDVPPPPPGFVVDGAAPRAPPTVALPEEYAKMRDMGLALHDQATLAAAQPKPPPDRLGENLTGINRGIYRLAGAPVDIISSALEALGGQAARFANLMPGVEGVPAPRIPEPVGGSAWIERQANAAGVPSVEPVDRSGRVSSRVLEEITSALIPTAGLLTKAQAVRRAGQTIDPRSILAPFANTPIRETVNQTALAGSAGSAAAVANEALPGNPYADIVASLLGSYGGSQLARTGGLAWDALGDMANPKRVARSDVGRQLVESMTDKVRDADTGKTIRAGDVAFGQNLDEARKLEGDVPGLKLTTGEATIDPGLQALEFKRRSGGPNVGLYEQNRQANRRAIQNALDDAAPSAANDQATRAALTARREQAVGKAADAEAGKAAKVAAAQADADAPITRAGAGEIIRSEVEAALARARGEERNLWRQIDPEGKTQVDTRPIRQRAEELLAKTPKTEAPGDTSPVIRELAGKTEAPELTGRSIDPELMAEAEKTAAKGMLNETEGFDELLSLKSRLSDEIRAERAADAPNANRIRKLSVMLDEVMTTLEGSAAKSPENAQAVEAMDKARAASRDLNERFTRGTAAEVTAVDARGRVKVENSELPGKFFKSGADGTPEALADFERAIGGSAKARAALRSYALDDAARAAMKDGKVDAGALEKWIAKHKDALDAYPDIRRDLGNVASAQRELERAQRRTTLLKDAVNDPKKSTVAKYLDRETARDSIDAILTAKNPRREMTNLVNSLKGNAEAIEGAKRAFWERMTEGTTKSPRGGITATAEDAAGQPIIKNAAFKDFLKKHGDAARILYADDPEHLKRLEKIADAVAASQRTTNIKPPGTSGTPLGVPGLTLAGLISRGYALQRGVVGLPYVIAESSVRAARRAYLKLKVEEVDRLLDDALIDPETAKTLVMEWNEANQKVIQRRLKLHLGHELAVSTELDDKEKSK